ncbi:hypothetical protein FMUND_10553 [Fusarium mundagurra]|uniref:Uncharacterized protein n=1 Tax=Fusarium mundagurra TaxID=1567541 RepID=A0A8H5YA86_9HYPO|nr:hypothetical protein FMUND_10553 [Fusarium mundagurra]
MRRKIHGIFSQDEEVTVNSSDLVRRSPSFASICDTLSLCPPPPPGLLPSSGSCETTASFPLSDIDSGYGTSSFDPDVGFDPILYPSTTLDVNLQLDELNYYNSSELPCDPCGNSLFPDEGELLLLNSSLKGNFHKLPPASNSKIVAEVPYSQTLQPPIGWHEPLTSHRDRDTPPEIAAAPYYCSLGTNTQNYEPSRHVPPQELNKSKAVTTGIPACVGKSPLSVPDQSAALVAEPQIVTRPDAGDIAGCFNTCASSPVTVGLLSPTVQAPRRDELSEGNLKSLNEERGMIEWVVSTKDAGPAPPALPSIPSPRSTSCSPKTIPRSCATGESLSSIRNLDETRDLVRELLQTLSHHDDESSFDEVSSVEDTPVGSTYSSSTPTDGSGTDTSPKSGTSAGASSFEIGSKRSHPTRDGSSQEGDGEEPSRKQSRQEKNPSNPEASTSFQGRIQMPCPVQQPQKCQGTNATISELLRSLEVNVPEEERKPENVRKRHKSETCEPRCIGAACSGTPSDEVPHHRRTANCPTWQSLPSETRWSFIWGLINPGENPPDPNFYIGVGYEHNTARRPCKQQSRPRGADICDALMRDIEERDKRRVSLEAELETANKRISQMEDKQKKKIGSLENIIETLLERLEENNVKVPNSLQKRLQEECPGVFCEPVAQLMFSRSQAPPTPSSMSKDGTGDPRHSQLNQQTTTSLQPPLVSTVGPGDTYSQPLDFDLSGALLTNFNYTDGVMLDSSQQLPGGVA